MKFKRIPPPDPSAFKVDIPEVMNKIIGLKGKFAKPVSQYRLTVYDKNGEMAKILKTEDRALISCHIDGLDPSVYTITEENE